MVLALGGGCARVEPRQALWNDAGRFVYPRPLEQVWPEVEVFLAEKGFPGRKVQGQYVLLTEYREYFHESRIASGFIRYYVDARPLSPVSCEVRILRHVMFTGGKSKPTLKEQLDPERLVRRVYVEQSHWSNTPPDPAARLFARSFNRDLQLEWALLQRLEPRAAAALAARHGGSPPKDGPPSPGAGEDAAQTALA